MYQLGATPRPKGKRKKNQTGDTATESRVPQTERSDLLIPAHLHVSTRKGRSTRRLGRTLRHDVQLARRKRQSQMEKARLNEEISPHLNGNDERGRRGGKLKKHITKRKKSIVNPRPGHPEENARNLGTDERKLSWQQGEKHPKKETRLKEL